MIVERSNFYVVAGGPGSRKTALIEAFRAQRQLCVDECIRKIIRQQVKIGGDGLDRKDQTLFQELILSWSIEAFESVSEGVRPVFFDRGIPELLKDGRPAALKHFQRAAEPFRYNSKVFMAPPWKQIYCTDRERHGDFDYAIKAYRDCRCLPQVRLLPDRTTALVSRNSRHFCDGAAIGSCRSGIKITHYPVPLHYS